MVGGQPYVPCFVLVPSNLLDSVVPDTQHPTQPIPGPHAIADLDGLNRLRAMLGAHEGAFGNTGVSAGSEAFDVLGVVGAVELGL